MRHILRLGSLACLCIAAFTLLGACGVLTPIMDAQAETLARMEALEGEVKEAQATAASVEAAYRAGEITQAERDKAIADIRASVLDGFLAVKDAMVATGTAIKDLDPAEVAHGAANEAAAFLPSPYKEAALLLGSLAGAWGLAQQSKKQAKAEIHTERDTARVLGGKEPLVARGTLMRPAISGASLGV